jgi:glucose-1-phosphate adenylyltransferase
MELSSERILVMILCGGRGERLYPLTKDRAKPSVPFLGSYRIIDFSLSNSLNSGFRQIALLTQYKSLSLERHILYGWNIFPAESGGYVISLPAQGRVADHWYEGTADAVFQNIYTIQQEKPDAILVLSGDHIYRADYRKVLRFMIQKKAEAVILAKSVDRSQASRFGVIGVDEDQRIIEFLEKPETPPAAPWDRNKSLISMGVYLFRTEPLIRALIDDAKVRKSTHDFGKDVIPRLVGKSGAFAYLFDGYWEDIGTLDAYWKANMAFLSDKPPFVLDEASWRIRTYRPQLGPSFFESAEIRNSIIANGCTVRGGSVVNSIISPGVRLEAGARVEDSIVFEGAAIEAGAKVRRAIIDKFAVIPARFAVGFSPNKDKQNFLVSGEGIRVVPKYWSHE